MVSVGKKLHHYVPRFYLKAWSEDKFVYCLMDGEVLRPNVRNVAAENHFYRLRELTPTDVAFIRELAIVNSPETLKPFHENLVRLFSLPHAARKKLEASGNATPKLLAGVDSLIAEMNENLHTSIEEDFKPYLGSMLAGDLRFYSDRPASTVFFRGIAAQYLRTNQINRARTTLGADKFETFQRVANVVVHIFAINLGFSLYTDRERYEIILLDNATDVPFITADQPVINIAARPQETKPPSKFELYYPLSPTKAMMLLEPSSNHHPASSSVTAASAHLYNLYMGAHSYQQIFASSPQELVSVRSDLPAFRSCFIANE
jgi:hypothetical protein